MPCVSGIAKDVYWFNCIVDDTNISEYFYNGFTTNWSMWLFMFFMMLYFFTNAFSSDDMNMYYNREDRWSHHPFYSIYHFTTEI